MKKQAIKQEEIRRYKYKPAICSKSRSMAGGLKICELDEDIRSEIEKQAS
jgi:hypothetical protein